jgi:hypothetical protein
MTDRDAGAWVLEARRRRCVVCGARRPHGHHIITQQQLRKQCQTLGIDYDPYRWDQRNLLALCERCHAGHHSKMHQLPMAVILVNAPKVVTMAKELNLVWWLSHEYTTRNLERRRRSART